MCLGRPKMVDNVGEVFVVSTMRSGCDSHDTRGPGVYREPVQPRLGRALLCRVSAGCAPPNHAPNVRPLRLSLSFQRHFGGTSASLRRERRWFARRQRCRETRERPGAETESFVTGGARRRVAHRRARSRWRATAGLCGACGRSTSASTWTPLGRALPSSPRKGQHSAISGDPHLLARTESCCSSSQALSSK